jgi:EmrB/QacA subfamily drug resistance transporter
MLPVILTATFMALFDFFVVNVAAPSLEHDLHAGQGALQLIVGGYGFTYATGLVTGGRLGDRFSYRRLFMGGMLAFALASLLCGLSQTAGELVAFRLLQGFTAAAMVPQVIALITATFPPEERGRAMSWLGVAVGLGSVAGQVLGGLLLQANLLGLGWRAIFLVNVPVGALALILAYRLLPSIRATTRPGFDFAGALGLAAALGLALVPLVLGRTEHWPVWTWVSLAAASPALYLVIRWERRLTRTGGLPLIDLSLFHDRSFAAGLAAISAMMALFGSFMLGLTLLLQSGLGLSPLTAGLTFGPLGIAFGAVSLVGSRLVGRYGPLVTTVGAAISGLGLIALMVQLAVLGHRITAIELIPAMVVCGIGNGLALPTVFGVILPRVRPAQAGAAAGLLTTSQQFSGAAGVALISVVFFSALGAHPDLATYAHAMIGLIGLDLGLVAIALIATTRLRRPARVVDLIAASAAEDAPAAVPAIRDLDLESA